MYNPYNPLPSQQQQNQQQMYYQQQQPPPNQQQQQQQQQQNSSMMPSYGYYGQQQPPPAAAYNYNYPPSMPQQQTMPNSQNSNSAYPQSQSQPYYPGPSQQARPFPSQPPLPPPMPPTGAAVPPPPPPSSHHPHHYSNPQPHSQAHPLSNPSPTPTPYHSMTRPPYVDPDTQIVYPCHNPDFEGWLTKQSMWLKDWRRRYFLLSGSKLFFAKNAYSAPHGMIDLSTATTVKSADIKSRKKHSFEISTHDMTYLMYADSEKEKDDWIGSVGRSIVRASGTFLTKNDVAGAGTATEGNGLRTGNYGYGKEDDDDEDDDGGGGDTGGIFENSENHPYFND
eukprot:CAMPEP_0176480224 /NCGR_PEP_ID=MMETSP0200_2-20121128/2164_1 /TAXON_ID=947934 /ORGANISM="Chaetoceros sp., Strain GSL56" /LENGTH=336 /DNA_ID=CAMNT_0017876331 /DNA_START=74 /DNA_END=1084 /DNA_ORIENTATION=+